MNLNTSFQGNVVIKHKRLKEIHPSNVFWSLLINLFLWPASNPNLEMVLLLFLGTQITFQQSLKPMGVSHCIFPLRNLHTRLQTENIIILLGILSTYIFCS